MIIRFTKENVKKDLPASGLTRFMGYDSRIVIDVSGQDFQGFPKLFKLESPATNRTINMVYLRWESQEYAMENECWDGEMDAKLYAGVTPEGKNILVELYTRPQY